MLDAGQGRVAEHQQVYKDQLLLDPTNWSIKNIIVGTIYVYISRHKCIVRIYMSFIRMLSRLNFPKITRKKKKQQQQQKKKKLSAQVRLARTGARSWTGVWANHDLWMQEQF